MKLTRKQLRRLIEAAVTLSDEEKESIQQGIDGEFKKVADASGPDITSQEVEDAYNKSKEEIAESANKEIKLKQVDNAIVACLKREGGAAGLDMLVDKVLGLETKTKKLPKNLSSKAKIKKYIKAHPAVLTHKYKDIILIKGLPKSKLMEALEKVGFYDKYGYGVDDIPNKTKAHDDIIGHT